MRNFIARILIGLGVLMIAGALGLTAYNLWDSWRAGEASRAIVDEMREVADIPGISVDDDDVVMPGEETGEGTESEEGTGEVPLYVQYPDMEMPAVSIDGYRYIGVLYVPSLDLELPVMEEWDYTRLRVSPCRYTGSIYTHDMVIAGHNYRRHFNRLKSLPAGSRIIFTDMDGNIFRYEIGWIDVVEPGQIERMTDKTLTGSWDLTLFTCTTGGTARYAIRCVLLEE